MTHSSVTEKLNFIQSFLYPTIKVNVHISFSTSLKCLKQDSFTFKYFKIPSLRIFYKSVQ